MFASAREHFVHHVWPSYRSFFDGRAEGTLGSHDIVRLGMNAATALYHMREHLPDGTAERAPGVLEAKYSDFGLLGNVANVSKHHTIDRRNPRVSNADQIFETAILTRYHDAVGDYYCPQTEVIVRLDDGTEVRLADVLQSVMTMWTTELKRLNIIDAKAPDTLPVDQHVPRAEATKRQLPLRLTQGEDSKLQLRLRVFNYAKNCSEPLDLTGCKVEMNFYAPATKVTATMALRPGDKPTDFDVPFNEEQQREYMQLKDNVARERYVAGVFHGDLGLQQTFFAKYRAEHPDFPQPPANGREAVVQIFLGPQPKPSTSSPELSVKK